jgi:hypothetical protein
VGQTIGFRRLPRRARQTTNNDGLSHRLTYFHESFPTRRNLRSQNARSARRA